MHAEIKHGSGLTPYYTTFINSTFEVCQVLNGTNSNPVFKWILDAVSETIPKDFFHPCPYFGEVKAYNVSLSLGGVFTQFLSGRYKGNVRIFDDKDKNIVTFKLVTEF